MSLRKVAPAATWKLGWQRGVCAKGTKAQNRMQRQVVVIPAGSVGPKHKQGRSGEGRMRGLHYSLAC